MRYVTLADYNIPNRDAINEALRIKYMRNMITEDQFKIQLQRMDKLIEKKREIRNIIELLVTTSTDVILRFYTKLMDQTNPELDGNILDELRPIIDYANGCLSEIGKVYTTTGRGIQFNYEFNPLP